MFHDELVVVKAYYTPPNFSLFDPFIKTGDLGFLFDINKIFGKYAILSQGEFKALGAGVVLNTHRSMGNSVCQTTSVHNFL